MKEAIERGWLAEIAVFQDTGACPHEYNEEQKDLLFDYLRKFNELGLKKAREFVFSEWDDKLRIT